MSFVLSLNEHVKRGNNAGSCKVPDWNVAHYGNLWRSCTKLLTRLSLHNSNSLPVSTSTVAGLEDPCLRTHVYLFKCAMICVRFFLASCDYMSTFNKPVWLILAHLRIRRKQYCFWGMCSALVVYKTRMLI
eukprot:c24025_g1_i1 orf=577-969(+)